MSGKPRGRPFVKGQPKIAGRKAGTPNKTTASAREAIERTFAGLGGWQGLLAWASGSSENTRIFYANIWPRILPLQLTGADGGPMQQITEIRRVIIDPKRIEEPPTIDAEPVAVDDGRIKTWAN